MRNKIRIVNRFILECIVILLPLIIVYFLMGIFLSKVTDFGRGFVFPSDASLLEVYDSRLQYGWIEFDTFGQEFKNYNFEVIHVFWGGLIASILLIVIGRILALGLKSIIAKRLISKETC
ncbi:hypothetical protein ACTHQ4_10690 [Alkalicoccobacillus gibsonii]|uniref:hypothetical protein n=1 Tax=Alkalicoccobacillus gibsonii TaxID=79881 RepID=UPI003F7BB122